MEGGAAAGASAGGEKPPETSSRAAAGMGPDGVPADADEPCEAVASQATVSVESGPEPGAESAAEPAGAPPSPSAALADEEEGSAAVISRAAAALALHVAAVAGEADGSETGLASEVFDVSLTMVGTPVLLAARDDAETAVGAAVSLAGTAASPSEAAWCLGCVDCGEDGEQPAWEAEERQAEPWRPEPRSSCTTLAPSLLSPSITEPGEPRPRCPSPPSTPGRRAAPRQLVVATAAGPLPRGPGNGCKGELREAQVAMVGAQEWAREAEPGRLSPPGPSLRAACRAERLRWVCEFAATPSACTPAVEQAGSGAATADAEEAPVAALSALVAATALPGQPGIRRPPLPSCRAASASPATPSAVRAALEETVSLSPVGQTHASSAATVELWICTPPVSPRG